MPLPFLSTSIRTCHDISKGIIQSRKNGPLLLPVPDSQGPPFIYYRRQPPPGLCLKSRRPAPSNQHITIVCSARSKIRYSDILSPKAADNPSAHLARTRHAVSFARFPASHSTPVHQRAAPLTQFRLHPGLTPDTTHRVPHRGFLVVNRGDSHTVFALLLKLSTLIICSL